MTDLEVAGDLRAAADYLRSCGWVQGGAGYGDGGAACMGIAIGSVAADDHSGLEIWRALGFSSVWPMMEWNDEPGRTLDEVLDRLESTALALEVRALSHETQAPLEVVVTPELVAA